MNISQFVQKTIVERKVKILQEQRVYVELAIKSSREANSFVIRNHHYMQKEIKDAILAAGYEVKDYKDGIKFIKYKYNDDTFTKCIEKIILEKFNLNQEYPDDNDNNVTKSQRSKIEKSIVELVNNMEDNEFRFPYVSIEFSLDFPRTRLSSKLKKELFDAGFRENKSSYARVPDYTGVFQLKF